MAIGHDLRLHDLYAESGLHDEFFVENTSPTLWDDLPRMVDKLMADRDAIKQRLLASNTRHVEAAKRNVELLRKFAVSKGLPVVE